MFVFNIYICSCLWLIIKFVHVHGSCLNSFMFIFRVYIFSSLYFIFTFIFYDSYLYLIMFMFRVHIYSF